MDASIRLAAESLRLELRRRGWTVAVAESCTGGLVAAAITAVPGASEVFREGYVVYSEEAKTRVLGVASHTLAQAGAVSAECAGEMAGNLAKTAGCDIALAVTGFAGPTGGTTSAPVGTVWFGLALAGRVEVFSERFEGGRDAIRQAACLRLLEAARDAVRNA